MSAKEKAPAMEQTNFDPTPANVSSMMERGAFHAHQDGRWRYSPYGAATTYSDDPTRGFDRVEVLQGSEIAANAQPAMYAVQHRDGTRSLVAWEPKQQALLWQMYAPRSDVERAQRVWLTAFFA